MQEACVLGKSFTQEGPSRRPGARGRARSAAGAPSSARRCSRSRPTRVRPSVASTASCRICSAGRVRHALPGTARPATSRRSPRSGRRSGAPTGCPRGDRVASARRGRCGSGRSRCSEITVAPAPRWCRPASGRLGWPRRRRLNATSTTRPVYAADPAEGASPFSRARGTSSPYRAGRHRGGARSGSNRRSSSTGSTMTRMRQRSRRRAGRCGRRRRPAQQGEGSLPGCTVHPRGGGANSELAATLASLGRIEVLRGDPEAAGPRPRAPSCGDARPRRGSRPGPDQQGSCAEPRGAVKSRAACCSREPWCERGPPATTRACGGPSTTWRCWSNVSTCSRRPSTCPRNWRRRLGSGGTTRTS